MYSIEFKQKKIVQRPPTSYGVEEFLLLSTSRYLEANDISNEMKKTWIILMLEVMKASFLGILLEEKFIGVSIKGLRKFVESAKIKVVETMKDSIDIDGYVFDETKYLRIEEIVEEGEKDEQENQNEENEREEGPTVSPKTPRYVQKNHLESQIIEDKTKGGLTRSRAIDDEVNMCLISNIELKTINKACKHDHWMEATKEKLMKIEKNQNLELLPRSIDKNIIGSKWVFRNELNENGEVAKNKARLVCKGFSQV